MPGTPFMHVVCYWLLTEDSLLDDQNKSFAKLWKSFSGSTDGEDKLQKHAFQNARFKLIPAIVDGPWLVRTAVPNRPALTGNKLTQRYFMGPNYMEVDMDIQSSAIAASTVALCRG